MITPSYRAGDMVWVKFYIMGYKYGEQNSIDTSYDVELLDPDGTSVMKQEDAAMEKSMAYYPQPYIPGIFNLTLKSTMTHNVYTLVITAHDAVGNQTATATIEISGRLTSHKNGNEHGTEGPRDQSGRGPVWNLRRNRRGPGGGALVFPRGPCIRRRWRSRSPPTIRRSATRFTARPGITSAASVWNRCSNTNTTFCCGVWMQRAGRRHRSSFSPIPLQRVPGPIVPAGTAGWAFAFRLRRAAEPSEIILHVQLLDNVTVAKQEALGTLGVNLIHAAFFLNDQPHELVAALIEGLRRSQVEVDMIRLSGPAFQGVDNRLMSLQLVEQGLTDATMFTAEGEVVQPSEAISGRAMLMERGAFRPVTNVTWEMLQGAQRQYLLRAGTRLSIPLVLMEMTLSNLVTGHRIDHGDFLARASMLNALGITVMVSNYDRFDLVTSYLRRYTKEAIVMVMGAPTLVGIFEETYYVGLPGGILEGLGRLFQGDTTLYVYPMKAGPDAPVVDAVSLPLAPLSRRLYWYLLESGQIQPVREFREEQLHVYPDDVLAKIQSGDATWESMVPPQVAEIIRLAGFLVIKHSAAPRRNLAVWEPSALAMSSGVPSATIRPPASPPSGPRSITQSAARMTSALCSMTSSVPPWSISRSKTARSFVMSSKCRPVVGSSQMKSVPSLVAWAR